MTCLFIFLTVSFEKCKGSLKFKWCSFYPFVCLRIVLWHLRLLALGFTLKSLIHFELKFCIFNFVYPSSFFGIGLIRCLKRIFNIFCFDLYMCVYTKNTFITMLYENKWWFVIFIKAAFFWLVMCSTYKFGPLPIEPLYVK